MAKLADATEAQPTRVRYGVLAFVCALSMITYLDRACMGSAAKAFRHDLGLASVGDLNWVFAASTITYALFEIPGGWLGDVFGPRRTLIQIVLLWSGLTVATGLVGMPIGGSQLGTLQIGTWVITPLAVLVALRALFGMCQAGAYPNITRALHNWFPLNERGRAQGMVWMCGRLMGGLTPLVWLVLVEGVGQAASTGWLSGRLLSWRAAFWLFGGIGVAWCLLFAAWFRNRPEEHRGVGRAELAVIRANKVETHEAPLRVPWQRLLASSNLWVLCLMYACQSYGWIFYMTYLPSFFEDHYGVGAGSTLGAVYKGGPLWLGALGCLVGGLATDWLTRRTGNRRQSRRLLGMLGHGLAAICFFLCPLIPEAFWFFVAIALSGFFTDLTMGPAWAVCQDIGRRYAAIVAGAMNMCGAFGGAAANWATGAILQHSLTARASGLDLAGPGPLVSAQQAAGELAGYRLNFLISGAVFVLGVICWWRIDPDRPVVPDA